MPRKSVDSSGRLPGRKKAPGKNPSKKVSSSQCKYQKGWPDRVIEMMAEGRSINEVCAEFHIVFRTFKRYTEEFPLLGEALAFGKELSLAWWEAQGREGLHDRTFQTALYQIHMRNRFKWSSGDRMKVSASARGKGKNGEPGEGEVKIEISQEEAACV